MRAGARRLDGELHRTGVRRESIPELLRGGDSLVPHGDDQLARFEPRSFEVACGLDQHGAARELVEHLAADEVRLDDEESPLTYLSFV